MIGGWRLPWHTCRAPLLHHIEALGGNVFCHQPTSPSGYRPTAWRVVVVLFVAEEVPNRQLLGRSAPPFEIVDGTRPPFW